MQTTVLFLNAHAADYITQEGNVLDVAGASYLGTWDAELTNTRVRR